MESVTSLFKIAGATTRTKIQVSARADAAYDQAKGRLFISLDALAEPMASLSKEPCSRMAWLPNRKHVTQDIPREDAVKVTSRVFHEWWQQVRASIPNERVMRGRAGRQAPLATTSISRRVKYRKVHHA